MNIFKKKKTLCLWHIKFSHVTRQFHSKDSRVPVTSPEDCLVDNLQKKYRRRLSSCIISFIFYYYKLLYLSTSLQTSWFFQWFRMKDTFAFPTNCHVRISLLGSMIFTRFVTWLFFLFFSRTCLYILLIWLLDLFSMSSWHGHKKSTRRIQFLNYFAHVGESISSK